MAARAGEGHWSLVFFTVLTQAAAGTAAAGAAFGTNARTVPLASLALLVTGALAAVTHLGRPAAARFTLANLRSSWLSREGALVALLGAALVLAVLAPDLLIVPAIAGLLLVAAISRLYMIRTVPAWNSWTTPVAFFATAALLGAAVVATLLMCLGGVTDDDRLPRLGLVVAAAAAVQILVAFVRRREHPSAHGDLSLKRILGLALGAALLLAASRRGGGAYLPVEVLVASVVLFLSEFLGRFLFYAAHRRVGL